MSKKGDQGISFTLVVQPGASTRSIFLDEAGRIKARVTCPPVGGRANLECQKLIARALNIRKEQVAILAGLKSKRKTIKVGGITEQRFKEWLRELALKTGAGEKKSC